MGKFNPKPSTILHLDLNSCFASIEQQADPFLRGKPIAVAAYNSPHGCIIAPSREAKKLGIKEPDPNKYRAVFLDLKKLLSEYTSDLVPKSIDEFILNLEGFPAFKKGMWTVGQEIKKRIKEEIGEFLTVSVGIAPNRFLAKTGAGLHKPDGLDEINIDNYREVYSKLQLMDLDHIKKNNCIRLNNYGIFDVLDFFNAPAEILVKAFHSVIGYDWYMRLHGWEPDDVIFGRRSYGNSYWHHGSTAEQVIFDSRDIYKIAFKILCHSPYRKPVHTLAESCFNLVRVENEQMTLLEDVTKKRHLVEAIDKINDKWGYFVITPAMMLGGIKELEEITIGNS